jgi:hypothetical protein
MKKIILLLFALVALTGVQAQDTDTDDGQVHAEGVINFEMNGKSYTATKITGNIMGDLNKAAILMLNAVVTQNGKETTITFYLKNNWMLKPGKTVLESIKLNRDFGTFSEMPANLSPADTDTTIDIDSESGGFTITSASMSARDKASISGSFEFTGKIDGPGGSGGRGAVKGSFRDLRMLCITKQVILGQ